MTDILNRIALMAGGIPGLAWLLSGWMATATGTGTTCEATKAAVADKQHVVVGFDISVRDDDLAADTYLKVELIEDTAGTPAVIATFYYNWDVDQPGQMLVPHIYVMLPVPIFCTEEKSISAKLTIALAPDANSVNLYGFTS